MFSGSSLKPGIRGYRILMDVPVRSALSRFSRISSLPRPVILRWLSGSMCFRS